MSALAVLALASQMIASMTLFGAPLFGLYGRKTSAACTVPSRALMFTSVLVGLTSAVLLLLAQTTEITGEPMAAFDVSTLQTVLFELQFGQTWLVRFGLLAALALLICFGVGRRALFFQSIAGVALVASFGFQGHGAAAFAEGRWAPALVNATHALAAGVWIGALIALASTAARTESKIDAGALSFGLDRFSRLGPAVVAVLALSGIANVVLVVGVEQLVPLPFTEYGIVLATKVLLFAVMLGFAALHRYVLAPRLARSLMHDAPSPNLQALRTSLIAEAIVGALVIAAAALLGSTAPPGA